MLIGLKNKDKELRVDVKSCNWFEKITGLMFTQRENAKALLFDFKKPVGWGFHSYFVFFPFIAIWLDDKNKIIEIKEVKPFKKNISPKQTFVKVIEIPINKRYKGLVGCLCSDCSLR